MSGNEEILVDAEQIAALEALSAQELEAKLNGEEDAQANAEPDPENQATNEPALEDAKAEDAKAASEGQKQPVVLSKNGEHTIAYSVLEKARQKAAALEETLAAAKERAEKAEAIIEAANSNIDFEGLDDEEMEALKEEMPGLAAKIEAIQAAAVSNKLVNTKLKQDTEKERALTNAQRVQEAIDANETLLHLQTNDEKGFQEIVRIDNILLSDPSFKDSSLDERFAEAVRIYEAKNGKVITSEQDMKEAANKAIEKAKHAAPKSLSDIGGGKPPVSDENAAFADRDALSIESDFSKMTADQIDAALNKMIG